MGIGAAWTGISVVVGVVVGRFLRGVDRVPSAR
jgi:hypothetical protein